MSDNVTTPDGVVLWPNRNVIVDGVVPTSQVSQDPLLFVNEADLDREMGI